MRAARDAGIPVLTAFAFSDENWQRPPEWLDVKACAVSVDSEDRVYCFNRNDAHPIVIFDRDGKFVGSWGEGLFRFPHAIRILRENGRVVGVHRHHPQVEAEQGERAEDRRHRAEPALHDRRDEHRHDRHQQRGDDTQIEARARRLRRGAGRLIRRRLCYARLFLW